MVMTLLPTDWAAEWVRPTTPDFRMVGPVLTEPGKPLPADLEVREALSCLDIMAAIKGPDRLRGVGISSVLQMQCVWWRGLTQVAGFC